MPAQNIYSLADGDILSSFEQHETDTSYPSRECQPLPWANYCPHLPEKPKFFVIPEIHKNRAPIVKEIVRRLSDAYFKPSKSLKSLQVNIISGSQIKSPRREAEISLLQVMAYYMDDATGRVGRRLGDGTFQDLSIKKLATYAKLRFKRAKRAMKEIVKAGYLKVTRQYTRNENGEYKGLASMRVFLPRFFIDLQVNGKLWVNWFTHKKWAQARSLKKQTKQETKKARAIVGLINETIKAGVHAGMNGINALVQKTLKITAPNPATPEHNKRLSQAASKLFENDSSRSLTDYLRELQTLYPTP